MKLIVHIERATLDGRPGERFGREELAEAIRRELAVRVMAEEAPLRPQSYAIPHRQVRPAPSGDVGNAVGAALYGSLRP
jgi:hypothetical protein